MSHIDNSSHAACRKYPGFLPLLEGVHSESDWKTKREAIRSIWLSTLGNPPLKELYKGETLGEDSYNVLSVSEEDDHQCQYIQYETKDKDTVYAYLLLPRKALNLTEPKPAVLALHPTSESGKSDIALGTGRANRRYGLELVSRGYIVLAPDSIAFGDRIYEGEEPYQTAPFYKQYPVWSAVGKMLADHIRGVDILVSLPQVNADRIGVIGHSLGGYNGWFLAGMDQRIKAVVSSCGFSMFQGDPDPKRWGKRDWFSHFASLTDDIQHGSVPFDWHQIAALAAPVPQFMWCGIRDTIFPHWLDNTLGLAELEKLYQFLGAGNKFELWLGAEGHDFPPDIRERAYRFLDAHLNI